MTPDKIFNIGVLAHVDAGKTTLTEQLLYLSGSLRKAGSVDSGTTQTDWLPIERERGISVRAAQTTFFWKGLQINLIDTPGHVDFSGEVERSMTALDGAILLISAVEGVQSHTENLWAALEKLHLPTLIFINKVDRVGSRSDELCSSLPTLLTAPDKLFLPLTEVATNGSGDLSIVPVDNIRSHLVEMLSDYNDEIAQAYLEEQPIESDLLRQTLAECVFQRQIIPIFVGSAQKGVGIEPLLDAITTLLPSAERKLVDRLSAHVFKIEHDKTMGKIAHVRMYGGELSARDLLETRKPGGEKISQIRKFNGQKYVDIGKVTAGDIAALCGLSSVRVFDHFGIADPTESYRLANPFLSVQVTPKNPEELIGLLNALRELSDEDPLLDCTWEKSEREIVISITGKMQLEVIAALLRERYNLSATFSEPSVIYKETPAKIGEEMDAYTMPKPCWAVVHFRFEPLARGSGVIYDGGKIPSNRCFYRYQEHIRRSFFANLKQGLYGWELTDFKATLVNAEHHTIHTHPLDFFVCTPMAIMNTLSRTGTTLLEPFIRARITASNEHLGRIIGDISQMRGEFDTPVIGQTSFTVECCLPVATSLDYPVRLAIETHGKGLFFSTFDGYRECPLELGKTTPRRGPNPLDRSKWILYARGAITDDDYSII